MVKPVHFKDQILCIETHPAAINQVEDVNNHSSKGRDNSVP